MSNFIKTLATKFYMWAFKIKPSCKVEQNIKNNKKEKQ